MGIRIFIGIGDGWERGAFLYCSTSGWAFGPMFESSDEAEAFLTWYRGKFPSDLRRETDDNLRCLFQRFRDERAKVVEAAFV